MRQFRFTVLVTFEDAALAAVSQGYMNGSRTHCVVQPRHQVFLPGVLARVEPSPPSAMMTILAIHLTDEEAEAFFAPGQRLTIWADAMVGRTIWGERLVGCGVVCSQLQRSAEKSRPRSGYQRVPRCVKSQGVRQAHRTSQARL